MQKRASYFFTVLHSRLKPVLFQMFIVCICTSSCRKPVMYIPTTQMKLPSSKKPCVLNRQADKHALLIRSCLAAFQEKPISRWVGVLGFFFLFQTNVFCLAFKLILLELHLSCLTALTLVSCLQRVRRHSHIHIIWHYGKKNICKVLGTATFTIDASGGILQSASREV